MPTVAIFSIQWVILYTDLLLFILLGIIASYMFYARGHEHLIAPWRRLGRSRMGMGSLAILLAYAVIGLADSLHFKQHVGTNNQDQKIYSAEILSLLDVSLNQLRSHDEKTYSAPFATHLYSKESIEQANGSIVRDYPRLQFGGAHLSADLARSKDITLRVFGGGFVGLLLSILLLATLALRHAMHQTVGQANHESSTVPFISRWRHAIIDITARRTDSEMRTFWLCASVILCLGCILAKLSGGYHVFGTDKIGQDVLYQTLKSIRTGLLLGTLTTLVMLPFAIFMGIAAGYFRGWLDDVIQYLYTTLNSIPSVLLIAAAVLMLQVHLDNNAANYTSLLERADMRLLFLCIILGITSWTSLCRYLRAETLKLREMDYIAAARSQGVGHGTILLRHILPNVMHLVLITVVLDFSGLVLAEAVLAYVQVGVDPTSNSWGNMINSARLEMAREPIVWWSLSAAFVFMFTLVLAANLFADAVRDALDPRDRHD